jgi:hypothetical protein
MSSAGCAGENFGRACATCTLYHQTHGSDVPAGLLGETPMTDTNRKPNDQRSDVKNPNNKEFKQARDNRANQLNPNSQPKPQKPGPK